MDLTTIGFVGLMTIGAVNVLTWFKPGMDSKMKFAASVLFAFALTFVPADIANVVLQNAKIALEAALGASGVYKLTQKVGGA